jgi:spore germination protein KC
MRRKAGLLLLLVMAGLLSGCWDKLEVEDQLFPVVMAVDRGERSRYRVTVRMPIAAALRAGILGGRTGSGEPADTMAVEADNLAQAMYIMNASVSRRITFRHLRGIIVSDELARIGMDDLMEELTRSAEIHETAGFWLARGNAGEVLWQASPTAEVNPGKMNEGLLLVARSLHMAPPVRLQHMITRRVIAGQDPFAPLIASNRRIMGEEQGGRTKGSAVAGDLDRTGANPMEIAGTAVFRDTRLAGFLTVDETQALLAMRGEMGKAYVTIPDPIKEGNRMMIRFQQENVPGREAMITPDGPRVRLRILLEGEVISGRVVLSSEAERTRVEQAANRYMRGVMEEVLEKLIEWRADPVGFGALFRGRFQTWAQWARWDWRGQIPRLQVTVDTQMRIRRSGLNEGPAYPTNPGD